MTNMPILPRLWLIVLSILLVFPNLAHADNNSVVLQLKWKHQFQFAGYYAAQIKGYFAEEGLDVEIREVDVNRSPLDTVLSGEAQFGISDSSLVVARMQGKKPVVIAAIFQNSPLVLLSLAESDIVSPLDLQGKRVMYIRDTDDAVLQAMFSELGLTAQDFIHVPHSFNDDDLINGKVDAISAYITDQPFYFREKGIPVNIISPSNYGVDFYGDMIFTNEKYLKENPQQVLAFRRAAIKGWKYAINNQIEMANWIKTNLAPDKTIENLLYEAEMTSHIILADVIDLGYFSPDRLMRIAEVYQLAGKAPFSASLAGIDYLSHIDEPYSGEKWVKIILAVALALSIIAAFQHYHNQHLKAKVREKTKKLSNANKSMQGYLQVINQWVNACTLSPQLNFMMVSKAWSETTKYTPAELLGSNFSVLISNHNNSDFLAMKAAIEDNLLWRGELQIHDRDGHPIWLDITIQPDFTTNNPDTGVALIATNITDKKRVEHLSRTDALTGLANRRHFDEMTQKEVWRSKRHKSQLSLIMLDIDFFKQYNDSYGHQEGDQCLQKVAAIIRLCAQRPADLAARFGGEEFVILLPDSDTEGANKVASLIQARLAKIQLEHKNSSVSPYITASMGVATIDFDYINTAEELIHLADERLYAAKRDGRNRICSPGILNPVTLNRKPSS